VLRVVHAAIDRAYRSALRLLVKSIAFGTFCSNNVIEFITNYLITASLYY